MSEQLANSSQINDLLADVKDAESFNYVFIALRGIQAGREYYSAMCPLRLIPKLFLFDEKELPPKLRAQRMINRSRIPSISKYIIEDPKNYVFSSITASIDGRGEFKPFAEHGAASRAGYLIVPMSAKFVINDGQHRRAAIEEALKVRPELGSEYISVVFFIDGGLKRSQQMFADLNKHALRPTMSLGILYNHRDPLASLCVRLSDQVPVFVGKIDFERSNISNRSVKLFTLSSLYQATKALLGIGQGIRPISQRDEQLVIEYWTEVSRYIPQWQLLLEGKTTACELRKNYMNAHGIALLALGNAGRALVNQHPNSWKTKLLALAQIDWSRSNLDLWERRAISSGRIVASQNNIILVTNVIKNALGLSLAGNEEKLEQRLPMTARVAER
jgi:DNA sulfur modification protein DndB